MGETMSEAYRELMAAQEETREGDSRAEDGAGIS